MPSDNSTTIQSTPQVGTTFNNDMTGPMNQGMQTGIALAQHAENIQNARAKLTMDQDTHKQMSMDKHLEILGKVAKAKGPYQKVLFDYANRMAPMSGMPEMGEDQLKAITANQDEYAGLYGQLQANRDKLNDPEFMKRFAATMDPVDGPAAVKEMRADLQKEASDKATAATAKASQDAQTLRNSNTLNASMIKQGNSPAFGAAGNIDPQAAREAATQNKNYLNSQVAAKDNANVAKENETLLKRDYLTTKVAQDKQIADDKNKTALELQKMKLEYMKANGLSGQEKRTTGAAMNAIMSNTKQLQDTVYRADRGMNLLSKPDLTYGEFKEVLSDYSKLLSGSAGNSITREQGMEGAFSTLADRATALSARYITNNPADATIRPETRAALKADFSRLTETVKAQRDDLLRRHIDSRVASGTFTPEQSQNLYTAFHLAKEAPAAPAASGPPAQGSANVDQYTRQAQAAIKAGKDPAAVRQLYKQKTGQELQ